MPCMGHSSKLKSIATDQWRRNNTVQFSLPLITEYLQMYARIAAGDNKWYDRWQGRMLSYPLLIPWRFMNSFRSPWKIYLWTPFPCTSPFSSIINICSRLNLMVLLSVRIGLIGIERNERFLESSRMKLILANWSVFYLCYWWKQ